MRVLLKRLLEDDGHTVETALDAEDALTKFMRGRFSLVITDVVMPGRSGLELRTELARLDPSLSCLLVSGADVESGLRYAASTYRTVFLAKPFEPVELLALVRSSPYPADDGQAKVAS